MLRIRATDKMQARNLQPVTNMMKYSQILLGTVIAGLVSAVHAGVVDTVEYATGFFVDTDANKSNSPYLRGYNQDWQWQHNAVTSSFASATLNISAYDVDASSGEVDQIWAMDDGTWKLLGNLSGQNNQWSFSTFTLGSEFYNDINAGLQVKIDISNGATQWVVTLAKSSISTDGAALPSPIPAVPEPETYAMLAAGLAVVGVISRRRKKSSGGYLSSKALGR